MIKILILGAGKIGSLVAGFLADTSDYQVHLGDAAVTSIDQMRVLQYFPQIQSVTLDVTQGLQAYLQQHSIQAVISCLPYFLNQQVAEITLNAGLPYFDITEDLQTADYIRALAIKTKTFALPQCGLAPGMVGAIAHDLLSRFEQPISASLRVGALPQYSHHALQYALTWSTDGLINEYANPCRILEHGKRKEVPALTGLETLQIDGIAYEAFYTSGGLGSLLLQYEGKLTSLEYKTLRYPGHCAKMRFLMTDLDLQANRVLLKQILETTLSRTYQDVVVIYVMATGMSQGERMSTTYVKKIYPAEYGGIRWSGIQLATASALCAAVDETLLQKKISHTVHTLEMIGFQALSQNRFSRVYR
ncbi:MAG: saccharopine dehydrogenase C-terminal domain-containing protein [Legionellaceae bacterium]|nr:saccharopine dehydrogenase C-terminal domain-containing protein [Legionellaceae bacterium]